MKHLFALTLITYCMIFSMPSFADDTKRGACYLKICTPKPNVFIRCYNDWPEYMCRTFAERWKSIWFSGEGELASVEAWEDGVKCDDIYTIPLVK